MKKLSFVLPKICATILILFAFKLTSAQTSSDTVRTGHPNDPMIVNPGKVNDGMAVKPAKPNDGMSVMSDTAFISKNIMDNRMEIQLSVAARDKGTTATVKKIAALMVADHTAILNDLESLAAKKHGNTRRNKNTMAMAPVQLPADKDFDQVWAGQMLAMHEAKILELESFIGLTKDEELKAAVLKALPKIKMHRELLLKIPGAKEKASSSPTI
jgi:putative membrane protein